MGSPDEVRVAKRQPTLLASSLAMEVSDMQVGLEVACGHPDFVRATLGLNGFGKGISAVC